MTKHRLRLPRAKSSRTIQSPPAAPLESPDLRPPIFSFEHMVDGYCVKSCEQEERSAFALSLHKRGRLSWRQLRFISKHKLGYEKIERSSLRVGLPSKVTPDVTLIAFRFHGMKAMIGYRDERIFHIIWLDPKFKVYHHGS